MSHHSPLPKFKIIKIKQDKIKEKKIKIKPSPLFTTIASII